MKKSTVKKLLITVGVIILTPIVISSILVLTSKSPNAEKKERTDKVIEWKAMTYEQKQKALEGMIANKDFENESELKDQLKEAINKEFHSEAVFHVEPSPYNEFSNVVEADSGWINITFNGTYRNYSDEKINFSGSAMLVYHPEDKTISVKNWIVDDAK